MTATTFHQTPQTEAGSIGSLLPSGHFSYGAPSRVVRVNDPVSSTRRRQKVVAVFKQMTFGMKVLASAIFFVFCLALPSTAAIVAFNSVAESPPVETVKTQVVPSSYDSFSFQK